MLKSSKCPKSAQKEQTMLKTHDRISKCSNCLQKRPKSTQKEQRMSKTHDRTPQCSREHSIPSFEPFTCQKTFGIESKYQQLYTVDYLGLSTTGPKSDFESLTTGAKYQLWIDVPCSFAMYSGYLKRSRIVSPPRISQLRAKTSNLALLSCRVGSGERVPLRIWCSPEKPGLRPGMNSVQICPTNKNFTLNWKQAGERSGHLSQNEVDL